MKTNWVIGIILWPLCLWAASWEQVPLRSAEQLKHGLPGGEGMQQVFCIKYAPSNPETLYLSSDTSGVWKSTDGGKTWVPKYNGFLANGAFSLGIDPVNEDIVFAAALSSGIKRGQLTGKGGIFYTHDGGSQWHQIRETHFENFVSKGDLFAFDTSARGEDRVLRIYSASASEGLLVTNDGGRNFRSRNEPLQARTYLRGLRERYVCCFWGRRTKDR